jgi:hypothetical protein
LESAAKAAGIEGEWMECMGTEWFNDKHKRPWNPLTDDGDEARLESALLLHVEWHPANRTVYVGTATIGCKEPWGDDRQAARRRAGVRAAAALGEQA